MKRQRLPILNQEQTDAAMRWLSENVPCPSKRFNAYLASQFNLNRVQTSLFRAEIQGVYCIKPPVKGAPWWLVWRDLLENRTKLQEIVSEYMRSQRTVVSRAHA